MRAWWVLAALLLSSCAWGNPEWRRESHEVRVIVPGAGDERCSDPAPWTNFEACLQHDAVYEQARCGGENSEQGRFAADSELLATLARDGYGELVATGYYLGIRLGAWWAWHLERCK